MQKVSRERFTALYTEVVEQVFAFWTAEMQDQISKHCVGWARGRFDFKNYLHASSIRCYLAYEQLSDLPDGSRICDVGGHWGVFPIVMSKLGFDSSMTEALEYYGEAFSPLFNFIRSQGVSVVDFDPFAPKPASIGTFDAVTVMAVLEHYPHSLRVFMDNVKRMVKPGGYLYLEVPNLAFLPKRTQFLFGHSPLVPISDIFESDVPFIGHHHEFTASELEAVCRLAGLKPVKSFSFNYSYPLSAKSFLRQPVKSSIYALFPATRECLALLTKS
jgi:2-polyprenyl-3-methyl-5-hydroxy-6-metoxy-1,4-benzoquinol methylase